MHIFKHLHTVNRHRHLVRKYCFRCGLYWRGLVHDLSKYSPTEFIPGARYYQGYRSPTTAERAENGYSKAWLHHKGRNRHHFEYWSDFSPLSHRYEPIEMPTEFLIEMFCDRIAASRVYLKEKYTDSSPLNYYLEKDGTVDIHPVTRKKIEFLLRMLASKGEKETFRYIKKNRKKTDFLTSDLQ